MGIGGFEFSDKELQMMHAKIPRNSFLGDFDCSSKASEFKKNKFPN